MFFIKHMSAGPTQTKWYLVQMDMYQSCSASIRNYEVYECRWYIIHHKDLNKHPTAECRFLTDIREMQQYGALGNMLPVIPLQN